MIDHASSSGGIGLEQSCDEPSSDWIRQTKAAPGVELFAARFHGLAYRKHRHDTYAIGLTESGIQAFDYRGALRFSTPGEVYVLHPDETHDGRAATDAGFGYRQIYVEAGLIFEAASSLCGRTRSLPFVPDAVTTSAKLAAAIQAAFRDDHDPLAIDDLVVRLAEGLLESEASRNPPAVPRHVDVAAIARARQFLDGERTRVVRSWELEAVTGLTRYELARQFRAAVGTSPYRYSLMRRLELARDRLSRSCPLADVALAAGFADQAHLTRMFAATFGITPARYRALQAKGAP